jgi:hypothetical protein
MNIKKSKLTVYLKGVLAILEGGGRIDCERTDGIWENMLYDVNGEYCGLIDKRSIKALNAAGKLTYEEPNEDQKIFYALEVINE